MQTASRIALCFLGGVVCGLALPQGSQAKDWVMALSWQSGYCEIEGRTDIECQTQTADSFSGWALSIHGLWPQSGDYCNVPPEIKALDQAEIADKKTRWHPLPALDLTPDTRALLDLYMPGRQSHLDRHEWIKHGTCSGVDPETYYRVSVRLAREANETATARFLRESIGQTLTCPALVERLTRDYGQAALPAIRLKASRHPDGAYYLTEIRFTLQGDVPTALSLATDTHSLTPSGTGTPCKPEWTYVIDAGGLE